MITLSLSARAIIKREDWSREARVGLISEKVGMRHHLFVGLSTDQEREKYDWFKRKIPFVLSRAMEEKGWETISLSQTRRARESLVETA